jgi:hypothetical protein
VLKQFTDSGYGQSYIWIDGFNVIGNVNNANVEPILIYNSSYIKLTRCSASGGADIDNADTISVTNSSYVLVEDCWAWGTSRYKFLAYLSDHIVFRRCVSRHDYMSTNSSGSWNAQCATFTTYDSTPVIYQNCIAIDSGDNTCWYTGGTGTSPTSSYCWGSLYGGIWSENNEFLPRDVEAYGSIFLNIHATAYGIVYDPKINDNTHTYQNCIFYDTDGGLLFDNYGSTGTYYNVNVLNSIIGKIIPASNSYSPLCGSSAVQDGPANTITAVTQNSILTGIEGTGVCSYMAPSYDSFYGITANETIDANSITSSNPMTSGLLYLPRIEAGSQLATAGTGGGRIGPTILWKIGLDHTLYGDPGWNVERSPANGYGGTADQLWPFPNEALIKADFASYSGPGPVGARGFATASNDAWGQPVTLTTYIWQYLGNQIPSSIYGGSSAPAVVSGLRLVPINP